MRKLEEGGDLNCYFISAGETACQTVLAFTVILVITRFHIFCDICNSIVFQAELPVYRIASYRH